MIHSLIYIPGRKDRSTRITAILNDPIRTVLSLPCNSEILGHIVKLCDSTTLVLNFPIRPVIHKIQIDHEDRYKTLEWLKKRSLKRQPLLYSKFKKNEENNAIRTQSRHGITY